jgi:hypothetical protein
MKTYPLPELLTVVILFAVFALFHVECVPRAQASFDSDALILSRAIVSEAGFTPGRETHALLHVLQWRKENVPALRHMSLARIATLYCSELNGRARTARAARTRRLTSADIPDAIESDVRSWLHGERPANICEGATDWASPAYVRAQGLRAIECDVPTQNAFVRRGAR